MRTRPQFEQQFGYFLLTCRLNLEKITRRRIRLKVAMMWHFSRTIFRFGLKDVKSESLKSKKLVILHIFILTLSARTHRANAMSRHNHNRGRHQKDPDTFSISLLT